MGKFAQYLDELTGQETAPKSSGKFARALSELREIAPSQPEEQKETAPTPAQAGVTTIPPKDPEALKRKIDAGMSPLPGGIETAKQAWGESQRTVLGSLSDQAAFGLPGRGLRAIGAYPTPAQRIPEPGADDARKPEDYLPVEETLTGVPAAAIDTATMGGTIGKIGANIGRAPAALARKLGASEAQTAVRPSIQAAADAAGGGAAFGGIDAVARGNDPIQGAATGAIGGAIMSQLPAVAGAAEQRLSRAVTANDLRPIKQMAKKGSLDKALTQFGNGDPEVGAKRMFEFVQQENLGPIFRAKGQAAVRLLDGKKQSVWKQQLEPIYKVAFSAEPTASVPMSEIETRLRASVKKEGGNEAELVNKAIAKLHERNESIRGRKGVPADEMPLDVLLTNASDFQASGHAGVVNYQDPTEAKMAAREVGRALRSIANDRVARVYERHPDAAYELATGEKARKLGVTFRDQPSTPATVRASEYPDAWARIYESQRDLAADVPRRLAEANRRYSDYAKLEPLVEQAATLKAGEKNFGLIGLLKSGALHSVGGLVGYEAGGAKGALAAMAAAEAAKRGIPYATRGAAATARAVAGAATSNGLPGALAAKPLAEEQ